MLEKEKRVVGLSRDREARSKLELYELRFYFCRFHLIRPMCNPVSATTYDEEQYHLKYRTCKMIYIDKIVAISIVPIA